MNLGLYNLTKDFVLSKVSQEIIFTHYLKIDINVIKNCVETNALIKSPLRKDENPTAGFKYSGKTLRFKDFRGDFWGDCFDLVAYLNNLNCRYKEDFKLVLLIIIKDLVYDNNVIIPIEYETYEPIKKKFSYKKREFYEKDAKFWTDIGVNKKTLEILKISPLHFGFIDKALYFKDDENSLGYIFEESEDKVEYYFPYRDKKYRYRTNYSGLIGTHTIKEKQEIILITKSYKDVACIKSLLNFTDLDITPICTTSENYLATKEEITYLWSKCKAVFTLFDFDFAGKNLAWRYKTNYNIPSLFLTDGKYNTKNYYSKDFSDYVKVNGSELGVKLIKKSYNYVKSKWL